MVYTNQDGKTILEVRYGSRVVEFSKGKAGIQVDAIDNLLGAIELVMKVVKEFNAMAGAFGRQG